MEDSEFWDVGRKAIAVQRYCSSIEKYCKTDRCLINEVRKSDDTSNPYVKECAFRNENYPVKYIEDAFEIIQKSGFDLEDVKETIIEMVEVLKEQDKKPKKDPEYFMIGGHVHRID